MSNRSLQEPQGLINTWELFHRLWSKAVGTPDYVKSEWRALEQIIPVHAEAIMVADPVLGYPRPVVKVTGGHPEGS